MDAYSRVITEFDLQSELKTAGSLNALKQIVESTVVMASIPKSLSFVAAERASIS